MLYHEYLAAGYIQPNASELLFSKHHLLANTTVFVAKADFNIVSTVSIVRDSTHFGLPMDDLYSDELQSLRSKERKVLEICSLASKYRGLSRINIQRFIKVVFHYAVHSNTDDVCIMVNPRHVNLYMNLFGFEIFGCEKFYKRVNAPAVALKIDAVKACQDLMSRKGFLHNDHLKEIKIGTGILERFNNCKKIRNPLNSAIINRYLSNRKETMQELSPECIDILKDMYPGLSICSLDQDSAAN